MLTGARAVSAKEKMPGRNAELCRQGLHGMSARSADTTRQRSRSRRLSPDGRRGHCWTNPDETRASGYGQTKRHNTAGLADSGLEPGTPYGSKLWFSLASSPEALFEAARRSTGERVEVERPIQMIVYGVPEAE